MKKILSIIGARPQIIKAAAIQRAIQSDFKEKLQEIVVHTGQHYDANMSTVFFEELGISKPDYNLNIGSGSHANQTAEMMKGIEEILEKEKPDCLLIYGDTNSTIAGSLAASKLHIPVVHIEAGLRSYNKKMPEEINRILSDHVSSLLFCPTETAIANLIKEGFSSSNLSKNATIDQPAVIKTGDVMLDNTLHFQNLAKRSTLLEENQLRKNRFLLATCHRPSNTDSEEAINSIFEAFLDLTETHKIDLVLPLHPRTKKSYEALVKEELKRIIKASEYIKIIPPVSFLEMIHLEANSTLIITDSGGVQKEAFFLEKACLVLREETEWIELVENGNAILTGSNKEKILQAFNELKNRNLTYPEFYGDGKAGIQICDEILRLLE